MVLNELPSNLTHNLSWVITAVVVLFLFLTPDTARIILVGAGVVFLAIAVGIAVWARRIQPCGS